MAQPPITPEQQLARKIKLTGALYAKQSALLHANICLSGGTGEENMQVQSNQTEADELGLKLEQVAFNGFTWPGDQTVKDLKMASDNVYALADDCADKPALIAACQNLIPMVPADSV